MLSLHYLAGCVHPKLERTHVLLTISAPHSRVLRVRVRDRKDLEWARDGDWCRRIIQEPKSAFRLAGTILSVDERYSDCRIIGGV